MCSAGSGCENILAASVTLSIAQCGFEIGTKLTFGRFFFLNGGGGLLDLGDSVESGDLGSRPFSPSVNGWCEPRQDL